MRESNRLTFYNTMLSRIGALKAGHLEDPESGESLSNVESTLRGLGIQLRDSNSEFRNFGEVLDDVGSRWNEFSSIQQRAIATSFAGTMQQTRFLALMSNWDQAKKYAQAAADSTGKAAEKLEVYQESLAAKQAKLTASFEAFSSTMLDSDFIALVYDAGAAFLNFASNADPAVVSIIEITSLIIGLTTAFNALKVSTVPTAFVNSIKSLGSVFSDISDFGVAMSVTVSSAEDASAFLRTLGYSLENLNTAQISYLVNTRGLTEEIIKAAVKEAELGEEVEKSILKHYAAATAKTVDGEATGLLAINMEAFTAGLIANTKAMALWLITNPIGQIILIASAFGLAKAAADKLTISIEDATSEYNKTASELESVNNELDTTKARIEELEALAENGRLTPDQELELKDLQKTNEELTRKVQLLQNVADLQTKQVADSGEKTYTKTVYQSKEKTVFDETEGKTSPALLHGPEYIYELARAYGEAKNQLDDLESSKASLVDKLNNGKLNLFEKDALQKQIAELDNQIANLEITCSDYKAEITSVSAEQEEFADAMKNGTAEQQAYADAIYRAIDYGQVFDESLTGKLAFIKESIPESTVNAMKAAQAAVNDAKDEAESIGVDLAKTVYGNIDLNNRQAIEWTTDTLNQYRDALMSWAQDGETWENIVADNLGTISTVLGGADEFNGIEIAYTPMLQTENGAVLLSRGTVDKYIGQLLDTLKGYEGGWTTEDLFALDAAGLEIDGQQVKGLIADIGDTAISTGEAMHYVGEQGAVSLAKIAAVNQLKTTSGIQELIEQCVTLGLISDNSYESILKLCNMITATGDAASNTADSIADLSTHIDSLANLEDQIKDLSEALAEFRDDGIVSAGTLKDLYEAFGDLPDGAFQEFMDVAGNSKSTFLEVQNACNSLAEAYIQNKFSLGELTEENKAATVALLKNMGVTNASVIVEKELAIARVNAKVAALSHEEATRSNIAAIYDEAISAETDAAAIRVLREEKFKNSVASTDFVSASAAEIQSLIDEADAAGIAAKEIASLIKLKSLKAQIDNVGGPGSLGMTGTEYLEKIRDLANQAQKEVESVKTSYVSLADTKITIKPTESKSSSSSTSNDDPNKDAFEAKYNEMKHYLEMEKISIEEFYDWLDGADGYKKYFADKTKYAEEWMKYEEEVFKGRRELTEDYLSDVDREIEALEREKDSEKQIIAKYREKQKLIKDLIAAQTAYLKAIGATEDAIKDNDYLKELLENWWEIQDAIDDIEDDLNDDLADGMEKLLDMTIEIVKQEGEKAKEALEEQADLYEEIVSKRREMLKLSEQERQYQDDIASKNAELAKLEARRAALSQDDSREARVEEASVAEKIAQLQKELADAQNEHWLDSVDQALEDELDAWKDQNDEKIDEIEDYLSDELKLRAEAIKRLENMDDNLYDKLLDHAVNYCDMSRLEFEKMWDAALAAAEKYGSYVNAMEAVPGSDSETDTSSIINQMNENRKKYAASSSASEKSYYDQENLKLGNQLAALTGQKVYRDSDGYWWIGNQYLFDYGKGTGSSTSSTSKKNAEKVSSIVDDMREYGKKWNANDPNRGQIHETVAQMAASLTKYGVTVKYDSSSGKWIITKDNNDSSNVGKWLYQVYHQGGVVGIPTPKQNEQLSLLEKGEMVLTKNHQNVLDKMMDYTKKFSQIPASVAGMFSSNNSKSVEINAPLYFNGETSDSKVLSILKKHSRTIANEVAKVVGT